MINILLILLVMCSACAAVPHDATVSLERSSPVKQGYLPGRGLEQERVISLPEIASKAFVVGDFDTQNTENYLDKEKLEKFGILFATALMQREISQRRIWIPLYTIFVSDSVLTQSLCTVQDRAAKHFRDRYGSDIANNVTAVYLRDVCDMGGDFPWKSVCVRQDGCLADIGTPKVVLLVTKIVHSAYELSCQIDSIFASFDNKKHARPKIQVAAAFVTKGCVEKPWICLNQEYYQVLGMRRFTGGVQERLAHQMVYRKFNRHLEENYSYLISQLRNVDTGYERLALINACIDRMYDIPTGEDTVVVYKELSPFINDEHFYEYSLEGLVHGNAVSDKLAGCLSVISKGFQGVRIAKNTLTPLKEEHLQQWRTFSQALKV